LGGSQNYQGDRDRRLKREKNLRKKGVKGSSNYLERNKIVKEKQKKKVETSKM